MASITPLETLKDIHLPEPITWWPLAWGWYCLIGLGVLFLSLGMYFFYQYYRHGRAKRYALRLLRSYEKEYQQNGYSQMTSINLSELLRRTALVYFPRATVASLHGDAWIDFLNKTAKHTNFTPLRAYLLELPYQNDVKEADLKPLFVASTAWIKQRGVPCSN